MEAQGAKIWIITTFNRKITDVESIERLARMQKTQVYLFEPSMVNCHAKSWIFRYANRDLDTAIIGSSNITGNGVAAAIEWNVLLQRYRHRDASEAIDHATQQFRWYLNNTGFKTAFVLWDVNMEDYERFKMEMQLFVATDEELMQYAAPNIQERWAEPNAELEQITLAERNKPVVAGSASSNVLRAESQHLPLPGLRIKRGPDIWVPPQRFFPRNPTYATRAVPSGYNPFLSRGQPRFIRDSIGRHIKDLLDTALQPGPLDDLSDDEVPFDFYQRRDLLEQSLPASFWEK
jgi:hypothetical protein